MKERTTTLTRLQPFRLKLSARRAFNPIGLLLGAVMLPFLSVGSASAASINGAVTDSQSGKPVVAAQISAIQTGTKNPEIKASTDSDVDGKFVLDGLPAGTYVITATVDGYRPGSQKDVSTSDATPATIGVQLNRSPY